jgi:hypothetical protein
MVVHGLRENGQVEQVVFYERGVGTGGFLDRLNGGAFGAGLSSNVRRAYTFLAQNYEPGDDIFIFGFSRGSYTARSLVGCLSAVGLLAPQACDEANLSLMWQQYRTYPADRLPTISTELGKKSYRPRIRCLGVFDTVGALGVPLPAFWRENRDLFGFHDVGLSPICDNSLHAVAIDEHREEFEATLWRQEEFAATGQNVEQVWFPGSHGDIGGGYVVEETRGQDSRYLDDLPLDWMICKVKEIDADFPVAPLLTASTATQDEAARQEEYVTAPQHESRRGFYCLTPFVLRSVGNKRVPVAPRPLEHNVCFDRHAMPIGEAVHISAVSRLGKEILIDGSPARYAPRNLIAAIRQGAALPVVGWDGQKLSEAISAKLLQDGLARV